MKWIPAVIGIGLGILGGDWFYSRIDLLDSQKDLNNQWVSESQAREDKVRAEIQQMKRRVTTLEVEK